MTVTSTTSPERKSSEEGMKRKRKKIKIEDDRASSETGHRIAQELPNCNWLEMKIKRESCKKEKMER